MGALRRIGTVAWFVIDHALWTPIRQGSLRRGGNWPRHLLPFVIVGLLLYVVMTAVALFAGPLRHSTLVQHEELSLPWVTLGPFVTAISFVLALAYAAALHVNVWVRVPALAVIITLATKNPLLADGPLRLVMLGEIVALVAYAAVRRRRGYSPWDVVVALFLIGNGIVAQMLFAASGADSFLGTQRVVQVVVLFSAMMMWAAPSILMAGAAMAELTISTASWAARGTWEAVMTGRRSRPIGAALLIALVVAAVVAGAVAMRQPQNEPLGVASGLVLLALVAAVGLGVLRLVPRGDRPGIQIDPDDLVQGWPRVSLALAVAFALVLFGPFPGEQMLAWLGLPLSLGLGGTAQFAALPVAVGVASWLARRGRSAAAMIVAALGVHTTYVPVANRLGFALNEDEMLVALGLAAVVALAYVLITRRLSADRGLAIGSVLLVSVAYPFREVLDEPFSLIATISGTTGGLLLGLVWRQLTEYGFTRRDSPGFPVASRVLLATANLTLVATAVAMYAAAAASGMFSLNLIESVGDEVIGGALLTAVCAAGLLLGVRGREGGDAQAGDEFQIFPLLVEEKGCLDEPPAAWFDQNVEKTRWR